MLKQQAAWNYPGGGGKVGLFGSLPAVRAALVAGQRAAQGEGHGASTRAACLTPSYPDGYATVATQLQVTAASINR